MADNDKTLQTGLDSSYDSGISSPFEEAQQAIAAQTEKLEREYFKPDLPWYQPVADVASEQLTVELWRQWSIPTPEPDPNFSNERLKELMDEDLKAGLSDRWLSELAKANSEAHYNVLRERAKQYEATQERLSELPWYGQLPRMFLAPFFDPTTLAIGIGSGMLAYGLNRSVAVGRLAQRGVNIGVGAGGALVQENMFEKAGIPRTTQDYLMAAGLGGTLGAFFGPMSRNPAVRREAEAIAEASRKMMDGTALREELDRLRARATMARPSETVGRQIAQEAMSDVPNVPPLRDPTASLRQAVDDVAATARGEPVDPIPSLQQAVTDVLSPEPSPAVAAAAPEPISVQVAKMADAPDAPIPDQVRQAVTSIQSETVRLREEVGRLRRELAEVDPAVAKRRDFVGEYVGADKGLYRVFAQDGDMAGPYKVTQSIDGKTRTIAMDLTSLRDAEALIPDQAPRPMLALSRLTDFGAPRFRRERAKDVGTDGTVTLKKQRIGRPTKFDGRPNNAHGYYVFVPDSELPVGYIELKSPAEGFEVAAVEIDPDFRGRNLQQRAYDLIEKEIGEPLKPSGILSDKGHRQWQKRNPELVKWHRPHPDSHLSGWWLSPKQLIAMREMNRFNWEAAEPGSRAANHIAERLKAYDAAIASLPPEAKTQAALDAMHDMGLGSAMRSELAEPLMKRLDKILPKGIRRYVIDDPYRDPSGNLAAGAYFDRTVIISLRAEDPLLTANHETIHALRGIGAFTQKDWRELSRYAQKHDAFSRYQIEEKYGALYRQRFGKEADDKLMEEAVAHMAADWMRGVRFGGTIDRLIERMQRIFKTIREFLGSRKATDIFEDIDSGRLAGRVDELASFDRQPFQSDWMRGRSPSERSMWTQDRRPLGMDAYSTPASQVGRIDDPSFGPLGQDPVPGVSRIDRKPLLSFAGEKSPLADLDALDDAVQMEKLGQSREEIWQKTGWFRGVDKKWRFEIDDSVASVRDMSAGKLRDAINHPSLMAASPRLKRTLFGQVNEPGYDGWNAPGAPGLANKILPDQIVANPETKLDPLALILHEAQHGLQREGDFARGSNVGWETPQQLAESLQDVRTLRDNGMIPREFAHMTDEQFARVLTYTRAAGEVEARTVEKRMAMSAAERQARPPWLDYDIPEDKQIVSFNEGPAARLADEANLVENSTWMAMTQESAPRGRFAKWRFDWSSRFLRSDNPVIRTIGNAFTNESTGLIGHRVNSRPADLEAEFYATKWATSYNRVREPALAEYAKLKGWNAYETFKNGKEFYDQVGLYIANRAEGREFDAPVKRLGDHLKTLHAEIRKLLMNPFADEGRVGRAVFGGDTIPNDPSYLMRRLNGERWGEAVETYGADTVIRLVRGAIVKAQPDIKPDLADRMARGYVNNVINRLTMGEDWNISIGEGNYEKLRQMLAEDIENITPAEIEEIITRLRPDPEKDAGRASNLKFRVLLAENHVDEASGLAFRDLLDNDVNQVFSIYARRMAGRIAMAKVQIRHPQTGELLFDGITRDAEFEQLLRLGAMWGRENMGIPWANAHNKADMDDLRFVYNRILGNVDPEQITNLAQWLRRTREYNNIRLLGQVGIAQLGEWGQPVGVLGLKAMMSHVPPMKRIIEDGVSKLDNRFFDELETLGIGEMRRHGFYWSQGIDDSTGVPFALPKDKAWVDTVDRTLKAGQRIIFEASGMFPIQVMQERSVAAGVTETFAAMARKVINGKSLSKGQLRRMAQLGLSEEMIGRISRQFEYAEFDESIFFGKKVVRLNLQQWKDLEARVAFERALVRMTRKLIQQNDIGNTAQFMSNPFLQTLFHLRGFGFTSWSNNFLHNVHMGDPAMLFGFATAVGWNAVVRALQVSMIAATRSDGEEYKRKHLDPWELGKAAYQRAGWSSIIPMGIDTSLAFIGQPGQFNARTTGQASDAIFGNTFMSFFDQAAKGIGGGVSSVTDGRPLSQAEVRNMVGLLPFSNLLPIATGLSYMIQDMPERAPRKEIN